MADNVSGLPIRGRTYLSGPGRTPGSTYGASQILEGTTKIFKDVDQSGRGAKALRSDNDVYCTLVRNASGITLLPKRVVKWKSGQIGKQVDGYCAVDFEAVAGVVDEWLPSAGVVDDDLFWIVRKGPTLVLTDLAGGAANVITSGANLVALTAATSQATTAGRVQEYAFTTNVTALQSQVLNRLGKAMSAKTTANTNADLLVDLQLI
jgi:hypothetical protein